MAISEDKIHPAWRPYKASMIKNRLSHPQKKILKSHLNPTIETCSRFIDRLILEFSYGTRLCTC